MDYSNQLSFVVVRLRVKTCLRKVLGLYFRLLLNFWLIELYNRAFYVLFCVFFVLCLTSVASPSMSSMTHCQ